MPSSKLVRGLGVLAVALLAAPAVHAAPDPKGDPPPEDLLLPVEAMDGTCRGALDPDCLRTPLTPEVSTARLRGDFLSAIAPGQARRVRLQLTAKAVLTAWVGAPEPIHATASRWPAGIEGDPSSALVIVGPRPGLPAGTGGPFVILVRSLRLGSFEVRPLPGAAGLVSVARVDGHGALPCGVGWTGRGRQAPGRAGPRRACGCGACRPGGGAGGAGGAGALKRIAPPTYVGVPGNVATTAIDLLVCYTPATLAWAGNDASTLGNTVQAYVDILNLALSRGWTGAKITTVTFKAVAYSVEQNHTIPTIWQSHLRPTATTWIPEAHTERDAVGADLVVLLIRKTQANLPLAGYADVYDAAYPGAPDEQAFSVIQAPQLSNDTLAHEIGHNLGCCHEDTDLSSPSQCAGPSYRHGFGFTPAAGTSPGSGDMAWATLMHTDAPPTGTSQAPLRIPWFSDATICLVGYGCTALGDYASAHNTRMIRETVPVVGAYR